MELAGAKACFDFLLTVVGLTIPVIICDRHRGVAKWIRECYPLVKLFFDTWHIAKGIAKKMLAASKKNGGKTIGKWITGVRNHIYWCSTSTVEGFEHLILAKWKSILKHISNKHDNNPDSLFSKCVHDELGERRKYIKVGMSNYLILLPYQIEAGKFNNK